MISLIFNQIIERNIALFFLINHDLHNTFFNFLMPKITVLGSLPVALAICLIVLFYGIITKSKEIKSIAIIALVALAVTDIAIALLKIFISQPRPFVTLDSVYVLVTENDPYSFPSGHTGNAFALATAFGLNWIINMKNKSFKSIWILIPIAIIVGFSRIYVGVHYPIDVLVGALLGIIGAIVATKWRHHVEYRHEHRDEDFYHKATSIHHV